MKVNGKFVFDEMALRKIAASTGTSGKATRQQVRIWLGHLVDTSLARIEEPRVRRRKTVADAPAAVVEHVSGNDVCTVCRRLRHEHHGSKGSCPLSKSVRPGSVFKGA